MPRREMAYQAFTASLVLSWLRPRKLGLPPGTAIPAAGPGPPWPSGGEGRRRRRRRLLRCAPWDAPSRSVLSCLVFAYLCPPFVDIISCLTLE